MNYYAYEMAHAFMTPFRFGMQALRHTLDWPMNPMAQTVTGKNLIAACEVFENLTRRYGKPEFGLRSTQISGLTVPVHQELALASRSATCCISRATRALPANVTIPKS